MIEVACYNCGSDRREFYASENGFTLVKCAGCGLLHVTPRPSREAIDQAHQCGVHPGESPLDVTGSFDESKIKSYQTVLRDLYGDDLKKGERAWLDIGCGFGEFLMALRQFSGGHVIAKGLEPNLRKQAEARRRGLDVSHFDPQSHARQYDCVSLLNVYSHLPDPPEFFTLCRNALKPGGELLVETGDAAHLLPDEQYRPMYLPDHLSIPSEAIVTDILRRCGFEIVAVAKYPVYPFRLGLAAKELVKLFWPGKASRFRYVIDPLLPRPRYKTDMYIRAAMKDVT